MWKNHSLLLLLAVLAACGDSTGLGGGAPGRVPDPTAGEVSLKVLSNRADLLSSGDALVELLLPAGTALSDLKVDVDGRDVTPAFALRGNGRVMGVVEGLSVGTNKLRVKNRKGSGAQISLINHPRGGPVFAGRQIQPWLCGTTEGGLGPALDAQCNAETIYELMYRSSVTQQFAAYDPASPPNDVASITTEAGKTVPYIVQVETGTMDRGIYKIAVVVDPAVKPAAWAPPAGWNGKLMYLMGGGTAPNHRQAATPSPLDDNALANGYMVITTGLNVHGNNSNDNVSAEMVMMMKEHVTERYGPIKYTIAEGCSGGGNQQYLIATQYPGLLDGLIPTCSYPDLYTPAQEVFACVLLNRYFLQTSPYLWAAVTQQADVMGHSSIGSCQSWESLFGGVLDPKNEGNCDLPADQVYDPVTNPTGTRCTINDYMVEVMGRRDASVWTDVEKKIGRGFANRPVDSIGHQYGYQQLKANTILAEQFVDMNEKIGGIDIDGEFTTKRMKADPGSAAFAHRGGLISDGRQLAKVPIIDLRGQDDVEIHTSDWSWVVKARLKKDHGDADNMIIFTGPVPLVGDPAFSCAGGIAAGLGAGTPLPTTPKELCTSNPLLLMGRWLDAVKADTSSDPIETKIVKNKPADAVDTCFIGGAPVTNAAACAAAFPYYSNPLVQMGGPFTNDNFDCQLKPLDRADYSGITPAMSDAQFARLQAVFPNGVCDWSKPSTAAQPSVPWLDYSAGPYGKPVAQEPMVQLVR